MDVEALRAAVVAEALSWEGTPFHDSSGVKGAGCDCVHLIIRTYAAVGLIADFSPQYKPQWFQNRDEPRFLQGLEAHGARRVNPQGVMPGDVLMYNYGRHAAHGGIVVNDTTIVHAYKPVGSVTLGDRREFEHKLDSAWTIFPVPS